MDSLEPSKASGTKGTMSYFSVPVIRLLEENADFGSWFHNGRSTMATEQEAKRAHLQHQTQGRGHIGCTVRLQTLRAP